MIANLPDRKRTSLDGRWQTIVDPYDAGFKSIYGQEWEVGWFRNFPMRPGLAEYDWERAPLLDVPGDWNSQDERLFFYEGTVWYKRDFDAPRAPGRRLFLHFGAANYEAVAYLNGAKLGTHRGGFTPFAFEVSEQARDADNFVVVRVNAERNDDAVPTTQTDWWNYGGLTRAVDLVEVPETFVREYAFWLAGPREVRGWVALDGPECARDLRVAIPELGAEVHAAAGADGRADFVLETEPERWSPESPRLYDVEVEAGDDLVRERVGFRTIETRGSQILLNGEPVFLRGISIHEEAPTRPGRSFGADDARTQLGWARELGCNFVRLAHYPHDDATARVADEMGLLVWAEIPVYWNIAWARPETLDCARQQLGELIARDRNRASVVLWSLTNESPPSDERLAFCAALARHARELDPTRLLTAALMAHPDDDGAMQLDDPVGEHLDVMGCNEYLGWYYGDVDTMASVQWQSAYDKPLIMSEFGAGALAGRMGDAKTLFTERHQARVYEEQIAMQRQIPFLAGMSPWILKDFRSPRRVLPGVQDYYNRKGLVSERGQRKLAFSVLQRFYEELSSI